MADKRVSASGHYPKIIDCTLREGQQSAGVKFNVEQSVRIGELLAEVGVDMIECGHPAVGPSEADRTRALVKANLGPEILAHSRAVRSDIESVARTGAPWIGLFLGINAETQKTRLKGRSTSEILDLVSDSIEYSRSLGLKVRYTLEDTSRTSLSMMSVAYSRATEAGASRITFSDTVGCCNPAGVSKVMGWLREMFPASEFEIHLHDDRGLSMANAIAAIQQGAHWISCSTNGLGERCGITDSITLLANLHFEGIRTINNPSALQRLSRLVTAYSRFQPDSQRPVVGSNAFTHVAKLHRTAVERDPMAYSWIDSKYLGRGHCVRNTRLPESLEQLIVTPKALASSGCTKYVMMDEHLVNDARQLCEIRAIPRSASSSRESEKVDPEVNYTDSLLLLIGHDEGLSGLSAEVVLGDEKFAVRSPASIFIPSGMRHSCKATSGSGLMLKHTVKDHYDSDMLKIPNALVM